MKKKIKIPVRRDISITQLTIQRTYKHRYEKKKYGKVRLVLYFKIKQQNFVS